MWQAYTATICGPEVGAARESVVHGRPRLESHGTGAAFHAATAPVTSSPRSVPRHIGSDWGGLGGPSGTVPSHSTVVVS